MTLGRVDNCSHLTFQLLPMLQGYTLAAERRDLNCQQTLKPM